MPIDLSTYFAGGFERKKAAPQFLSGLCEEVLTDKAAVKLDSRVVKSLYSIDLPQCTGGRFHDLSGYDSVDFKIPQYNDYTALTDKWFLERPFGAIPYGDRVADAVEEVSKNQGIFSAYQANAKSKQVADGLLNGKIKLVNGSEIKFNKKDTHDISVTTKFTESSAKILDDLAKGCKLIKNDGLVSTNEFHFITNGTVTNAIVTNDEVQKIAKKLDGIDLAALGMPEEKTPGATLSGRIACGAYIVNIWSYDGTFTIPKGFGLASEGKTASFIPDGRGILLPKNPELKMYYGGLVTCPNMSPNMQDVFNSIQIIKAKEYAYCYPKANAGTTTLEHGVKSAPLFVPVNPDCYVSYSNLM